MSLHELFIKLSPASSMRLMGLVMMFFVLPGMSSYKYDNTLSSNYLLRSPISEKTADGLKPISGVQVEIFDHNRNETIVNRILSPIITEIRGDTLVTFEEHSGAIKSKKARNSTSKLMHYFSNSEQRWIKTDKIAQERTVLQKRFKLGDDLSILLRKDGYFNKEVTVLSSEKRCMNNFNPRALLEGESITEEQLLKFCLNGFSMAYNSVMDPRLEYEKPNEVVADILLEPIVINKEYEFSEVFFPYNSAKITARAATTLKKEHYPFFLRNPHIVAELRAHADSRGRATYNMSLSERRARACADYLIKLGIHPDRLQSKGFGESKLKNRCGDGVPCSPAEHAENRRMGIAVTDIIFNEYRDKTYQEIMYERQAKGLPTY